MGRKRKAETKHDEEEQPKRTKAKSDPDTTYRQRINCAIYKLTGNYRVANFQDVNKDPVVLHVESKLKEYLSSIRSAILKKRGTKRWELKDVYSVLDGTLEYYGAQRFIIVKRLSRKASKVATDKDVALKDPTLIATIDEEEEASCLDVMREELDKLDDKTRLYKIYENERTRTMEFADALTESMNKDEYTAYHSKAIVKDSSYKDAFCRWMGWPSLGEDFYAVFSWLAVNKIKLLVENAMYNRRRRITSLFLPRWIIYEKQEPLEYRDFLSTKTIPSQSSQHLQSLADEEFLQLWRTIDKNFKTKDDPSSSHSSYPSSSHSSYPSSSYKFPILALKGM